LIPSIVRSRIQDGGKKFSEAQEEATVVFIDIESFDEIGSLYTGKELIELLDRVYNSFDSICEQYGLLKIETVGKTYMACGGLKVVEKDIDNRLLGSHHSVRVTDFACSAQSYVYTQTLRNSKKLGVKIGIHIGDVIAGVVGETKP
jgi:class 3 adenylate cyclase